MISEQITRLQTAKADIKAALEDKGVEVSSSAKLDSYASLIEDMSTGDSLIETISEEDFDAQILGTTLELTKLLKRLIVPSGITNIPKLWNMVNLEYVEVPNTITTLGDTVFGDCAKLKKIKFEQNSPITVLPTAFARHNNNENGVIIENIPTGIVTIGTSAFEGTHITQFPTLNNCTTIGSYAFKNCDFDSVTIPTLVTQIPICCFWNCQNLETLNLSNVQTIGADAFTGCTSLHNITIPATVTNIDGSAFSAKTQKTFTFLGTTPPSIAAYCLGQVDYVTAIYVPSESVNTYKEATNWDIYANKIQAIPTV